MDELARQASMAPRTFARRLPVEVTGTTPAAWLRGQRLLAAERLLETSSVTVDAIAHRTGLGTGDTLRRQFARARGVPPEAYRRAFRRDAGSS